MLIVLQSLVLTPSFKVHILTCEFPPKKNACISLYSFVFQSMCANILVIVFFIVSCPSIKRGIIDLTIIFYTVVLYLYFSVFTANPLSEGTRKNCKCDDR